MTALIDTCVIEERFSAALVPEGEQPYAVPENWCWVRLGAVCSFVGGGTPSKNHKEYWNGKIPWASVKDVKGDYLLETVDHITEEGLKNSSASMCEENDLLLVTRIEPAKTIVSRIETSINQDLKIVKSELSPVFLHYYFKTFKHEFERKSSGSTVKGITLKIVQNEPFPLPPRLEQKRIVNLVESLFSDLDEAKEKLTAVLDGFAQRKAAILHRAFTGELTAKWREENGIGDWLETSVDECSSLITKGASPKWQGVVYTNDNSQTLFVTSENVREGYIDWSKEKYLDNAINEIQKRSVLQNGDVLVNIVGASIGRSAIFDRDCLANTNQAVCLVRVKSQLLNKFLCYYFNSPFALMYYDDNKVETARANISLKNQCH